MYKRQKLTIFKRFFTGLANAYGTYNPTTGRARQVKAAVTDQVIVDHLTGRQPYGVYLLVKECTRAVVADFDDPDKFGPVQFLSAASHYGIEAYIERSKSKGYHVWIFFSEKGVTASKARIIARHILDEIEQPLTEIFPKQDRLDTRVEYGNFIFAPLFGALVPHGKTVFIDPATFKPYLDQWSFLESVKRAEEYLLDEIIELNNLQVVKPDIDKTRMRASILGGGYGLPRCARMLLRTGVERFQRVSCFRLAVNLNKVGIPYEMAESILKLWAKKNKPNPKKRIITEKEIIEQASYAYRKGYLGYGCEETAILPFCHPKCMVRKMSK